MSRRLSILIYHRVLPRPDPLQPTLPDAALFARHMRWLRRFFNVLPLVEAVQRLRDNSLPPRAAAITFDDGYADNHDVVLPILNRLGLRATFFVASGFLNGGCMWNDMVIEAFRFYRGERIELPELGISELPMASFAQRAASIDRVLSQIKRQVPEERLALAEAVASRSSLLGDDLMMSDQQVRSLKAAGMTIGAHTRWHPILEVLDDASARDEIRTGKDDLEYVIDEPVRLFAYPNGYPGRDYSQRHVDMVETLGFEAAVSTAWGAASCDSARFELPRFTPWDTTTAKFLGRLFHSRLKA